MHTYLVSALYAFCTFQEVKTREKILSFFSFESDSQSWDTLFSTMGTLTNVLESARNFPLHGAETINNNHQKTQCSMPGWEGKDGGKRGGQVALTRIVESNLGAAGEEGKQVELESCISTFLTCSLIYESQWGTLCCMLC